MSNVLAGGTRRVITRRGVQPIENASPEIGPDRSIILVSVPAKDILKNLGDIKSCLGLVSAVTDLQAECIALWTQAESDLAQAQACIAEAPQRVQLYIPEEELEQEPDQEHPGGHTDEAVVSMEDVTATVAPSDVVAEEDPEEGKNGLDATAEAVIPAEEADAAGVPDSEEEEVDPDTRPKVEIRASGLQGRVVSQNGTRYEVEVMIWGRSNRDTYPEDDLKFI